MKSRRIWGACLSAILLLAMGGVGAANAEGSRATADSTFRIVQLGDSYSAGNGTYSDNKYYENANKQKYYRSNLNWGSHVANWLRHKGVKVEYKNLARSGYTTQGVIDDEIKDMKRLSHKPDVVFMTIGGNDVDFNTIARSCFVPMRKASTCKNAIEKAMCMLEENPQSKTVPNCRNVLHQNDNPKDKKKKQQKVKFVDTQITEILKRLENGNMLNPNGRVVLLAYPYLSTDFSDYVIAEIEPFNFFCHSTKNCYPAADMVRKLGKKAVETQKKIVDEWNNNPKHKIKVDYVDSIPAVFGNHEPDPRVDYVNEKRWINELFESAGRSDKNGIVGDSKLKFLNEDPFNFYHPNVTGHEEMAAEVVNRVGGKLGLMGTLKSSNKKADIDIVFVVDATGSMGDDIYSVKEDINNITKILQEKANSARMALVTYRHFPDFGSKNYPSRVDLNFSSNPDDLKAALEKIEIGGGSWIGDASVYSGVMEALRLDWRDGVKKITIVLGDGDPIEGPPEKYTWQDVAVKSFNIDPVEIYAVDSGILASHNMKKLINQTEGKLFKTNISKDVPGLITEALGLSLSKPSAWLNGPIAGQATQPVVYDALGSYSQNSPIAKYEWDFNGDGIYDKITTEPRTTHVFAKPFHGFGGVRVTTQNGLTTLSSVSVDISPAPNPKLQEEAAKQLQKTLVEEKKRGVFELTKEDARAVLANIDPATGELKSPVKLKGDYTVPGGSKNPSTTGTTGGSGGGGSSFSPSGGGSGSGDSGNVLSGKDRYETAVKASRYAFPSGAQNVYLASGEVFPDALAAGPVAGKNHAPVLLTHGETLPETVKTELQRLKPTDITLVGGTSRLQPGLETTLRTLLPQAKIQRVSGTNRYETAAKLAATLGGVTQVTVASGENYPDALAAGGVSPAVLLTKQGSLPTSAASVLRPGAKVTVAGGNKAVTPSVFTHIESIVGKGKVTRIGGKDRYDTATLLAKALRPGAAVALVAVGNNFPDALIGGAIAQNKNGTVVLSNTTCVPKPSADYLTSIGTKIYLGGKTYTGTTTCQ